MSPEFKKANSSVVILKPQYKDGMPEIGSLLSIYKIVEQMIDEGKVLAAATPGYGGVAEALFKMCVGNHVGLSLSRDINLDDLFKPCYGAVILELLDASAGEFLGSTTVDYVINVNGENTCRMYGKQSCSLSSPTSRLARKLNPWNTRSTASSALPRLCAWPPRALSSLCSPAPTANTTLHAHSAAPVATRTFWC